MNNVSNELVEMVKQASDELEKIANDIYEQALQYGMEKVADEFSVDYGSTYEAPKYGPLDKALLNVKHRNRMAQSSNIHNRIANALRRQTMALDPTNIYNRVHAPVTAVTNTLNTAMTNTKALKPGILSHLPHKGLLAGAGAVGALGIAAAIHGLAKKERLLRSATKYVKAHKNALLLGALGAGGTGIGAYALTKQSSLNDPEYVMLEQFAMTKIADNFSNSPAEVQKARSAEIDRLIKNFGEVNTLNSAGNPVTGANFSRIDFSRPPTETNAATRLVPPEKRKGPLDKALRKMQRDNPKNIHNQIANALAQGNRAPNVADINALDQTAILKRPTPVTGVTQARGVIPEAMRYMPKSNLGKGILGGAGLLGLGGLGLLARKLTRKQNLLSQAANLVKNNRTAAITGLGAAGLVGAGAVAANR